MAYYVTHFHRSSMAFQPDTKNWTWVLQRECPECGFDVSAIALVDVSKLLQDNAVPWQAVLRRDDVATRPDPVVWSALEYGAHVLDACRVFAARLALMLEVDDPQFDDWDQDATAESARYGEQEPATVAAELSDAAHHLAAALHHLYDVHG